VTSFKIPEISNQV